jgi:exonuclease SbcC
MQFIEVRRTAIPAMTQAKESIKGLKDNDLTTDQVPGDLEKRWRNMDNKYLQWNTQLDNAKEAAHTAKAALDQYCDQHPNITMERLSELNSHRQEEIETIRVAHQALYKAIDNATGAIGELNKRQQELKNKKPDFGEENAERLEAMIAENEEKLNAAQSQYADLKAKLRADEENVRLKGQKKEALDKAEAEYLQWAELNRRLGSADGKTFRRIAQSYILGELLHIANGYLRQFNDR